MAGYCRAYKCNSKDGVVGKVDYISNPDRQEYIESFYDTAPEGFWQLLADESQKQFNQQIHQKVVYENGERKVVPVKAKCCEAREFVIGIPQHLTIPAQQIAEDFKATYGVECAVAVHWVEEKQNYHAHLIFAERELLPEPKVVERKRTYYYDAEGKKCKKADAVKVVPKGIETRYFTDKRPEFKTQKFAMEYKNTILSSFGLKPFDKTRHFPTKHIGRGNPKEEYSLAYNNLVNDLNSYFDLFEELNGLEELNGSTPLQVFCKQIEKDEFNAYEVEEIEQDFAKFKELHPISKKMAQNRFESLLEQKEEIETDLNRAKELSKGKPKDFLERQLYDIHKSELTSKYNQQGLDLVELLKNLMQTIISKIEGLIKTTKHFNIDLSGGSALERIKSNDEINLD